MRPRWLKLTSLSLLLVLTYSTSAATSTLERILIPIHIETPVAGAHGSLWTSVLLARNLSPVPINIHGVPVYCPVPCPPVGRVASGQTVRVYPDTLNRTGRIVQVEQSVANDLAFSLRVQDISRQSQTWGTEIPVVREHDLRSSAIGLLGVPLSAAFRTTLRIYAVDPVEAAEVRVRLFGSVPEEIRIVAPEPRDTFIGEKTFLLAGPRPHSFNYVPSYLELHDLAVIASGHSYSRVDIEIVPVTPGLRLWAFVAVVNNETQHVTTITPQ